MTQSPPPVDFVTWSIGSAAAKSCVAAAVYGLVYTIAADLPISGIVVVAALACPVAVLLAIGCAFVAVPLLSRGRQPRVAKVLLTGGLGASAWGGVLLVTHALANAHTAPWVYGALPALLGFAGGCWHGFAATRFARPHEP